jgi:hypothetical protein
MLTITISGPAKSGKSMLVNLLQSVLVDLIGLTVTIDDANEEGPRRVTTKGIGMLLRQMYMSEPITIQTKRLGKRDKITVMRFKGEHPPQDPVVDRLVKLGLVSTDEQEPVTTRIELLGHIEALWKRVTDLENRGTEHELQTRRLEERDPEWMRRLDAGLALESRIARLVADVRALQEGGFYAWEAEEWHSEQHDPKQSTVTEAYLPGLGTVRECRHCACLVAGGPTSCKGCIDD